MRVQNAMEQDLLDRLTAQHQAMKARLRELEKHLTLTSAERLEYIQLKKIKLQTKEKIQRLQQN